MIIYSYKCDKCDQVFDMVHGINETPEYLCSICGDKLRRNFTVTPVVFKGAGWSVTDKHDDSMMKSVHPAAYKAHKEGKI